MEAEVNNEQYVPWDRDHSSPIVKVRAKIKELDKKRSENSDDRGAQKEHLDKRRKRLAQAIAGRRHVPQVDGDKGVKKEALNFTEYCDAQCEPLYEADGLPKCPPGYRYSKKEKQCVPKTEKDDVGLGGKKDSKPSNGANYNVWGNTGINGDGYAWAEPNAWGDGGDSAEAVPFGS